MSVRTYQTLLSEARNEIEAYIRQTDTGTLPPKTLNSLRYTHGKMAARIDEAINKERRPLKWKAPEVGSWHAVTGDYEISIYKEGGAYFWQINCTDGRPAKSLDEAMTTIDRLLALD